MPQDKRKLSCLEDEKRKIDQKIVAIQNSTRTLFYPLAPAHHYFRNKSRFYYNWHLNPHYQKVHIATLVLYLLLISTILFQSIIPQPTLAATSSATWTTYNDFNNNKSTVNSPTTQSRVTLNGSGNPDDASAGSVTTNPDSFSESFSTTTYKDTTNTNADWNTTDGKLKNENNWTTKMFGDTLYGLYFISETTGIAVGTSATILYTNDGGASWLARSSDGYNGVLISVYFPSASVGYISAASGNSLKTTDGGKTWTKKVTGAGVDLQSTYFISETTGVMVGNGGKIIKTTDGGANYSSKTSGTANDLYGLTFADSSTAIAVGQTGTILKSTDAGETWESKTSGVTQSLYKVNFTSATTGYAVGGEGKILKTTDAGETWVAKTSGISTWLLSVSFTSATTGYVAGDAGVIRKTTDSGESWSPLTSGTTANLKFIHFPSATTGYVVGDYGVLRKTTDSGSSWSAKLKGFDNCSLNGCGLWGVHFPSATAGYVVGNYGLIYKTTDAGATWTQKTSGTTNILYSVYFPSSTIGYAVGQAGTIIKTTDSGESWSPQTSGKTSYLTSVYFISDTVGYVVGQLDGGLGTILKTTDGGTNWVAKTSGTNQHFSSVYFTSSTTGYVVGNNGTILKTTDSGETWVAKTSGTTQTLSGVYFTSATTGYAVGGFGTILKTTDAGETWVAKTSGTTNALNSVHFPSATTGYAVGNSDDAMATILKTTNSGESWSRVSIGITNILYSVYFTSDLIGYAVGSVAVIHVSQYMPSQQGQSLKVNSGTDTITGAKISATQTLNGQTVTYYLSADGGVNWESATLDSALTFANTGNDLRWKAVLATNGTTSPEVDALTVQYNFSGNITNLKINAGGIGRWGTLSWSGSTPGSSLIKFQTRSASTEVGLASASWGSEITASGASDNINSSGTANNVWLELRLLLEGDGTNSPTLNDFTVTYLVNTAPTAPTSLYSNNNTAQAGQTNPTDLADITPAFSAIYNDPDSGDIANKARIQVSTDSGFASVTHWDSGSSGTSVANCTAGNRCQDLVYGAFGTTPSQNLTLNDGNVTYFWRVKFWDDDGDEGVWSESATFTLSDETAIVSTVSDSLSTVTFSSSTLNIGQTATITIILKDTNGNPVSGKKVVISSSRGSLDLITQPASLTDSNGLTIGYITSSKPGQTVIIATDETDNVTLNQRPIITFVKPTVTTASPNAILMGPKWVLRGQEVSFDASGSFDDDGQITKYDWNFADEGLVPVLPIPVSKETTTQQTREKQSFLSTAFAQEQTQAVAKHAYQITGRYALSLIVQDNDGNSSSVSHTIEILPHPPVILEAKVEDGELKISGTAADFGVVQLNIASPGEQTVLTSVGQDGRWQATLPQVKGLLGEDSHSAWGDLADINQMKSPSSNVKDFYISGGFWHDLIEGQRAKVLAAPPTFFEKALAKFIPQETVLAVKLTLPLANTVLKPTVVAVATISILFVSGFWNIPWYLYYLFNLILERLGLKRKRKPWGVVYDAVSKAPISIAVVRIFSHPQRRLLETRVTDNNGRFGFAVPAGDYFVTVTKPGFIFASKLIKAGTPQDDIYTNLYHGAVLTCQKDGTIINSNIPIDPMSYEEIKAQLNKNIFKKAFYQANLPFRLFISNITLPFLIVGIFIAILSLLFFFEFYTPIFLIIYILLIYAKVKRRIAKVSWGLIYDYESKKPIETATVKIFDTSYKELKEIKVTNKTGRFGFLVPPGQYFLEVSKEGYQFPAKIEVKNDGLHHNIYTQGIITTTKEKPFVSVNIPLEKV